MVYRRLLRWKHRIAGALVLAGAVVLTGPQAGRADTPSAEGWSFHAPGTLGSTAAPAQPATSKQAGERENWTFRSPNPEFDPNSGPGKVDTGTLPGRLGGVGKGSGFAAPKEVAGGAKPSCKAVGG